jgi:hypothetical protein
MEDILPLLFLDKMHKCIERGERGRGERHIDTRERY